MGEHIFDLIIEKIKPGTTIPKILSKEIWKVKSCEGKRRGEEALIYEIPNHKNPKKPHQKGINATEWDRAYKQLLIEGEFTLEWFRGNMDKCSEEGNCNYYTIGSIFTLLGIAEYETRGLFINKMKTENRKQETKNA